MAGLARYATHVQPFHRRGAANKSQFSSIIIAGFGFSRLNSLLLGAPGGLLQIFAIGCICLAARYIKKSRIVTMIVVISFALVGVILMVALPEHNKWGRWTGIFLLGPFATSIPISLSLITSNVGGLSKKATVSAMLFIAYCTGNVIGPQLFLSREAPDYPVCHFCRSACTVIHADDTLTDRSERCTHWVRSCYRIPCSFVVVLYLGEPQAGSFVRACR